MSLAQGPAFTRGDCVLYVAERCTQKPYRLRQVNVVHVMKKFFPEQKLANRNQIITIGYLVFDAVRRNKPDELRTLLENSEDADEGVETITADEENAGLFDSYSNCLQKLTEASDKVSYVSVVNDKSETSVCVYLNTDSDPAGIFRNEILNLLCEDDVLCDSDKKYAISPQQLTKLTIQDDEVVKPCFYPLQELAAEEIVKRIRFILQHYTSKRLEDFKKFDFRIFTARSNMLETQTANRLYDARAGCFSKDKYTDHETLTKLVETRVKKYVNAPSVVREIDELLTEVQKAQNSQTLYLIVADEAHWGTSSAGVVGESANNNMVNIWKNCPNVIVLLVTATPWNLLTENSRIPEMFVVVDPNESNTFLPVKEQYGRLCDLQGRRISSCGPKLNLHVMKWSEVYKGYLTKGLIVTLRVLQKLHEDPIWLCVSREKSWECQSNIYPLLGSTESQKADSFLIQKAANGNVRVLSTANDTSLVAIMVDNQHTVGFMSNEDIEKYPRGHSRLVLCNEFKLTTEFNESLIELQPALETFDNHQLHFSATAVASGDGNVGRVVLSRKAADIEVVSSCLYYHDTSFTFFVEKQVIADVTDDQEEYLSLNMYYNSIRNRNRDSQLIRSDDLFQDMVNVLTNLDTPDKVKPDEILAADYAFYIVLIDLILQIHMSDFFMIIRQPSAQFNDLDQFLQRKEVRLKKMSENLAMTTDSSGFQAISSNLFDEVVRFKARQSWENFLRYAKSICNRKSLLSSEVSEFVDHLCFYYAHTLPSTHAGNMAELKHLFGATKLESIMQDVTELFLLEGEEAFMGRLKKSLSKSETFHIVDDLMVHRQQMEISSLRGHMKVVRLNNVCSGNSFYTTLCRARTILSKDVYQYEFEILRYFSKFQLKDMHKHEGIKRIWQVMQRKKCSFMETRTQSCPCEEYCPEANSVECINCSHAHTTVTQLSDLDKLPCIVILVENGRVGDTYPPSFNVMDLRVRFQNTVSSMASMIQELGRMCRYQRKPAESSHQGLPYALVGPEAMKIFEKSLLKGGAPFYCAFGAGKIDARTSKRANQSVGSFIENRAAEGNASTSAEKSARKNRIMACRNHFDYNNSERENNRILFQAEPQIGKTGVYLCTIATLRRLIEEGDQRSVASNYRNQFEVTWSDEEIDSDTTVTRAAGQRRSSPHWLEMMNSRPLNLDETGAAYLEKKPSAHMLKLAGSHDDSVFVSNADTKYATFNRIDHQLCMDCKSFANAKVVTLSLTQSLTLKVSIPTLKRFEPLFGSIYTLNGLTRNEPIAQRERPEKGTKTALTSFIFHPSRGSPAEASVNYHHAMADESGQEVSSYVQILVVHPSEFKAYCSYWQTTHAIMELPGTFPECGAIDVDKGGDGYARRFIQLTAEKLNLRTAFIIDDNISRVFSVSESDTSAGRRLVATSFFSALSRMESLFSCRTEVPARDWCDGYGPIEIQHPVAPYLGKLECECETLTAIHRFTGPTDLYGTVGLDKLILNHCKPKKSFRRTHVSSLVLLNIDALKTNGVSYQPKQDCERLFSNECNAKGLFVCKYCDFIITKRKPVTKSEPIVKEETDWLSEDYTTLPCAENLTEDTFFDCKQELDDFEPGYLHQGKHSMEARQTNPPPVGLKAELQKKFQSFREKVNTDFDRFQASLLRQFEATKAAVNNEMENVAKALQDLQDDLDNSTRRADSVAVANVPPIRMTGNTVGENVASVSGYTSTVLPAGVTTVSYTSSITTQGVIGQSPTLTVDRTMASNNSTSITPTSGTCGGQKSAPVLKRAASDESVHVAKKKKRTSANVKTTIKCQSCNKPRCVYSDKIIKGPQKTKLLEFEKKYCCGNSLPSSSNDTMYLEKVESCSTDVSIAYYTTKSQHKKVCYKCGANKDVIGQPKNEEFLYYRPVCKTCLLRGEKPNSRKQRKDKGMNRTSLDTKPQVTSP